MADPVTTNRNLAVPTHGSDVDTWDIPINNNFGLIDTIVGGVSFISTTGGDITLNAAQLACGTISVSGALTSTARLIFPAVQGWWSIENLTTGNHLLQIVGGAGTQVVSTPPGEIVDIQFYTDVVKFRNLGRVGSYLDLATTTVPIWIGGCTIPPYLYCDGSTFSGTTYPALASLLGGTTLPDTRGRGRFSLNDGTNRITTGGSGINGNNLFGAAGVEIVTLQTSQIPVHSHPNILNDPGHTHNVTNLLNASAMSAVGGSENYTAGNFSHINLTQGFRIETASTGMTISNANAGLGGAHNNMPPAYIGGLTFIRAA